MWEGFEETAILVGLDMETFWKESPKQFEKRVQVYMKKEDQRIREWDAMNHMLGRYMIFAFNQPKSYPQKPFLKEKETEGPKKMNDQQMEAMMKRLNSKYGGKTT